MTPLALAALAAQASLQAAPAPASTHAPAADYGLDADVWNGFGYFLQTAEEARVQVSVQDTLDLAALEPEDVVLIVYPTQALPAADLLAFVEAGGSLIIADDAGSSAPLLATLGVTRSLEGPRAHLRYSDGDKGLPIVSVAGQHFLFFHVDEVVANHPATYTLGGAAGVHPILSFDGGRDHLVVEARRGQGALLAIADPSMFLNEMLRRFYGNKQFAANVLRYYCVHEPCRLKLALPNATFANHFDRERARLGDLPKDLAAAIEAMNEALAEASADLAEPPLAGALPVVPLVAMLAVLGVLLTFLRRRTRAPTLSGFVGPPEPGVREPSLRRPPASLAPSVEDALGLVVQRDHADFGGLALTLAEQTTELLRALGDASAAPPAVRDAAQRITAEAADLRARQPIRVTADQFLAFYQDVQLLARHVHGPRRSQFAVGPASGPTAPAGPSREGLRPWRDAASVAPSAAPRAPAARSSRAP